MKQAKEVMIMKKWTGLMVMMLAACLTVRAQTVDDAIAGILSDPVVVAEVAPVVEPAPEAALPWEAVADVDPVEAALADDDWAEGDADDRVDETPAAPQPIVVIAPDDGEIRVDETPAAPQPIAVIAPDDGEIRVRMEFEDTPFPDVVRAFRQASGANIISGWTNPVTHLVTMRLDNVPWKQGLMSILRPYGLEMREEPRNSNIFVISEHVVQVQRVTQTFELNYAKAEQVSELFKSVLSKGSFVQAFPSANAVIVKATESELIECEEMLKALDKPARQVYIEARFVRLSSAASKRLGMRWDSLGNVGVGLSNMRGGMQVGDARVATYDVSTTDSTRRRTVYPDGTSRDYNYDVRRSTMTLIPDEYTAAPLANLNTDDFTWRRAAAFGGVLSVTDVGLAFSAFEQMDGVQMFSNPKVIVENETKAKIDMTEKYPNVNIDYQAATQTGQRDSISSRLAVIPGKNESWVGEAFFSYGISLEVTPRVSPTGLITVEIIPSISSLARTLQVGVDGAENSYPIINVQRLDTTFSMGDGKTAVIGGLTETSEQNVESGVPLLRNIPWIGPRLFGWKSRQKTQDEIIIFVTVGIIDGETIEENAGMPKNAVLGRGLFDGSIKEPGDRTDAEMFNLEQKPERGFRIK